MLQTKEVTFVNDFTIVKRGENIRIYRDEKTKSSPKF